MIKLAVIADDFTGTLDTGVQFVKFGASVKILTTDTMRPQLLQQVQEEILVINTETRHLSPAQAYTITHTLVSCMAEVGIPNIYIKTDSGLRGNIGMVLKAALEASGHSFVAFVPAFPDMGRTTVDGIHFVGGQTIDKSVFGADPFEPVRSPYVKDLFAGLAVTTVSYKPSEQRQVDLSQPSIGIFDAQTNGDLEQIAVGLQRQGLLNVVAGCAGFASVLPPLLGLCGKPVELPLLPQRLLVVCGSLNPITKQQLEYAQRAGFYKLALPPWQLLDDNYFADGKGDAWLQALPKESAERSIILDTGISTPEVMQGYMERQGITKEDARRRISCALGQMTHRLAQLGYIEQYTLMIIGGDTLMGFVGCVDRPEISPVCEVASGVVLFKIEIDGQPIWMLSKSGGFGDPDLLQQLTERIIASVG